MAAGGRGPGTHTDEPVTILWSASPFPHPPLSSPAVRSASRAWWVAATNCVAAVAPHPRSPPPSPTCLPAYLCTCSRTCPPVRPPSPCALAAPRRPARPPTCSPPPRTNGGASRTLSLPPPPPCAAAGRSGLGARPRRQLPGAQRAASVVGAARWLLPGHHRRGARVARVGCGGRHCTRPAGKWGLGGGYSWVEAGEGEDGGRSARQPSRAVPWVWILGEGG